MAAVVAADGKCENFLPQKSIAPATANSAKTVATGGVTGCDVEEMSTKEGEFCAHDVGFCAKMAPLSVSDFRFLYDFAVGRRPLTKFSP